MSQAAWNAIERVFCLLFGLAAIALAILPASRFRRAAAPGVWMRGLLGFGGLLLLVGVAYDLFHLS
jgi:hypothetical protein